MADENLKNDIEDLYDEEVETTVDAEESVLESEEFESTEDVEYVDEDCEKEDNGSADENEMEENSPGDSKEVKKGFFGKKKDKKDKKDIQIEELTDRLKRQMAEFDNFRKRTEKEKCAMYEVGAKGVIEKILPVVDNFERGLAAVPEEQREDPFVCGMEKIYKQFMGSLEELEVKVIEAVGKEFDPNFHNAVMHVEDQELDDNIVAEEFQKGYTYRENVVRHSMVKVAN